MVKLATLFIIYSMVMATLGAYACGRGLDCMPQASSLLQIQPVEKWIKNIKLQEGETLTKLHFFVHDNINEPNKTVYNVAEASITSNSPSSFGRTQVIDHLLTMGPEIDSEKVGRIQGIHVLDDFSETALTANWNIIFNEGLYEGSTITVLGRLVAYARDGELSIVGGTGSFILARGIAVKRTYSTDPVTQNMIMEYDLYVLAPKMGPSMA